MLFMDSSLLCCGSSELETMTAADYSHAEAVILAIACDIDWAKLFRSGHNTGVNELKRIGGCCDGFRS
jgi:hypothetical protein